MQYKEYIPPKFINSYVECYWTNTLYPGDFKQPFDYIIPDGNTDAIFMLNGSYTRKEVCNNASHLIENCSLIPGFYKAVKVIQKPYTSCFGIRFKPGAVQNLTGISLKELDRSVYSLEEFLPELADLVMNNILANNPLLVLIDNINQWFIKLNTTVDKDFVTHRFLKKVLNRKGQILIHKFCTDAGIHISTLQKNFKTYTGLTPKQYSKIVRFNYLLNNLIYSTANLTQSTYEMGYFDQSHLNKEFKEFLGLSPTEFIEKDYSVAKLAAIAIAEKNNKYILNF